MELDGPSGHLCEDASAVNSGSAQRITEAEHDDAYFRELLDIASTMAHGKFMGSEDSSEGYGSADMYWKSAIESCDLIYRDSELALFLGTLDAAVDLGELTSSMMKASCESSKEVDIDSITEQVSGEIARIKKLRASIPPPPSLVEGKLVYPTHSDGESQQSELRCVPETAHRIHDDSTTLSPPPLRGIINCCAFDKHFVRSNKLIDARKREAYPGDTMAFYSREWGQQCVSSCGGNAGRGGVKPKHTKCHDKSPPGGQQSSGLLCRSHPPQYLELRATDTETYDISKHFHQVCEYVKGIANGGEESGPHVNAGRGVSSSGASSVYVHCVVGSNRSATIVCCLLMYLKGWSAKEVVSLVSLRRRCRILTNRAFIRALIGWEKELAAANLYNTGFQTRIDVEVEHAASNLEARTCDSIV